MSLTEDPIGMIKAAYQAKRRIEEVIDQIDVEASAGGGMVTVRMNGHMRIVSISIAPEATEDVEVLEDLVRAACNEACRRAQAEGQERVKGATANLAFPGQSPF